MARFSGLKFLKNSVLKRCACTMTTGGNFSRGMKISLLSEQPNGAFFLTMSGLGVAATCWAFTETTNNHFDSSKCRQILISAETTLATIMDTTRTMTTQMDYLEHDPQDYDIYIKNPTANDLPYLLNQFEEHGKEVWPWIWTHPNEAGPHFVFVGVNVDTLYQIRQLRSKSPSYNILVIASEESILEAANEACDPNIYDETYCGIVSDASVKLLNIEAKMLMLSDERVIAFNSLIIT
jgi:hypothetical protein